ncbi:MAG: PD40 domain-containing protein [Prevotella sp.]|nr:PD40 domain-containing protein [Prevotella sp.]
MSTSTHQTREWMTVAVTVALLMACGQANVPEQYTDTGILPKIYPEYFDVTIPVNIAPLTFELLLGADETVTRYSTEGEEIVCSGVKACPDINEWKSLTQRAKGKDIYVEVFAKKDGQWFRFKPFDIHVSRDSIDAYLSYRLISPSYVAYEELTLNQRCLENFDESVIVDNMLCSTESGGQCVNCHNYQQYNPDRMQFHARQNHGGTVVIYDGKVEKVNMACDSLLSAGVYPSWHPWLPIIAYSTNKTMQAFHTTDVNKIEVLDAESDLMVYDVAHHEVMSIEKRPDEFEIFPFWAPDGRTLYFCSAHFEYENDSVDAAEVTLRAKELKYNIYRKSFNPETLTFGEREIVFDAAALDKSATLPRVSPDGRWLMFTLGEWGCFHIWHRDADLWMMDLQRDQEAKAADAINSNHTESYHSWSSNGRWVVFSSRRNDGVFTRPFIAHFEANGAFAKPFELPSENPDYHRQLMKSYNVPELMQGPVRYTPQEMAKVLQSPGINVKYVQQLRK